MECVIHKAGILYQEQHHPETEQLGISLSKNTKQVCIKEIPLENIVIDSWKTTNTLVSSN
jgi:hypothetical protein